MDPTTPESSQLPLLVLSDLHLGRHHGGSVGEDCGRLIASHGRHEVLFAGDTFDLSTEPAGLDPALALADLAQRYRSLGGVLKRHFRGGGTATLIAGNHDAGIVANDARRALLARWELTDDAPLTVEPWFVRRGAVHVEHGHLYDPDNAPAHPLTLWTDATEPLGIALTRRFLAPSGALAFAHEHELTPLKGFRLAFRTFGRRAPRVIGEYFRTAVALTLEADAKKPGLTDERSRGQAALAAFSDRAGLSAGALQRLVDVAPMPTHFDSRRTFMRLYFDRIVAGLALSGGLAGTAAGLPLAGAVALTSAGYLGVSTARGISRYSGLPEQRLRLAAERVRNVTGAGLVIFGHTHHEEAAAGYLNLGSFAYGRACGRSYVTVDAQGRGERRRFER